jgi:hypothetical protein
MMALNFKPGNTLINHKQFMLGNGLVVLDMARVNWSLLMEAITLVLLI